MFISLDSEKHFDRIQRPFNIKILDIFGMQGTYFNIIKVVYNKAITSIHFSGQKLKIRNKTR